MLRTGVGPGCSASVQLFEDVGIEGGEGWAKVDAVCGMGLAVRGSQSKDDGFIAGNGRTRKAYHLVDVKLARVKRSRVGEKAQSVDFGATPTGVALRIEALAYVEYCLHERVNSPG